MRVFGFAGENVSFDGLRRHAEAAHCHVRGNAAYAPLIVADNTALYNLPVLSDIDTNEDDSDYGL